LLVRDLTPPADDWLNSRSSEVRKAVLAALRDLCESDGKDPPSVSWRGGDDFRCLRIAMADTIPRDEPRKIEIVFVVRSGVLRVPMIEAIY